MKVRSLATFALAAFVSLAFAEDIESETTDTTAATTSTDDSSIEEEQVVVEETETDLLNGAGIFDSVENLEAWTAINSDYYLNEIILDEVQEDESIISYLQMTKLEDAIGTYDDGLYINFGAAKPQHITVKLATSTGEIESCDIRLTTQAYSTTGDDEEQELESEGADGVDQTEISESQSVSQTESQEEDADETSEQSDDSGAGDEITYTVTEEVVIIEDDGVDEVVEEEVTLEYVMLEKEEWTDVLFYRFGYFNYQKLNLQSMIHKFEEDIWYQVDLVINWDEQRVNVYVDGELSEQPAENFFTKDTETVDSADTIVIYGLTPGSVSKVRDLKVCTDRCIGGSSFEFIGAHYLTLSFITLLAVAATIF